MKHKSLATLLCLLLLALLPAPSNAETVSPITITPATLPAMTVGVPYSVAFGASGGTAPYAWSSVSLPAGLGINPTSGVLSGTPTVAGSSIFFVKVSDAQSVTGQRGWSLTVAGGSSGGGTTPTIFSVTVTSGTINGTGLSTASFAAGTTITITASAPPAGQWFQRWNGNAPVGNSTSTTTSFTMPSGNVSEAAIFYTPPSLVSPVTTHPRLWITQNDLPRLRSWATPGNAVYQQGLRTTLNTALYAHGKCFPNGVQPAVPYPDAGDVFGYSGAWISTNASTSLTDLLSEQHALVLAFFALIDPNPAARVQYAQKARQMFMYQMNEAVKGHLANAPFRDPIFAIYNRSNGNGEAWPLIADWLQGVTDGNGQPVAILDAADKLTIRNVFMMWGNDCLNAYTTGGDHPSPIGITNSTTLLPHGNAMRVAGNNYYSNHARLISMMPLALDAADDPPVNAAAPASVLGNTLRSYILDATGAWLYQQFALYGDPATVCGMYGLGATSSVGLSSGGLPVEGGLYGHSYAFVTGQMLALQTGGYNDATLSGPQIALIGAPVWDRFVKGFISQMMNTSAVPASASYLGPVYQFANYGDLLRLYVTPDFMQSFALLALLEQQQGQSTHLNEARWFAQNAVTGGAANMMRRITAPWNTTESILYFLLFDPAAPAPVDPRPAYATTFYDAPQARLLRRTNWSPQATVFTYRAAPASTNHENADGGQFELYRNGEFLTKELSNYDSYGNGQSSMWHNTLALKNWCAAGTPVLSWFESSYWPNGSGWNNGMSAGDPVSINGNGANYSFVQSDLTNQFNRPGNSYTPQYACMDIAHASRSILHLNGDFVVVYDRATSLHTGLFKRFNLNMTTQPFIDNIANTATAITPRGQRLFVKTLLPVNPIVSWVPLTTAVTNVAELEPTTGRIVVSDPAVPANARFLHVLQAADSGTTAMIATAMVQSSAGGAFDGAQLGSSLVMFANDITVPFNGVTYAASPSATTHYVTGLAPNATYSVTEQTDAAGNVQITITTGGSFTSDSGGVLVFNP